MTPTEHPETFADVLADAFAKLIHTMRKQSEGRESQHGARWAEGWRAATNFAEERLRRLERSLAGVKPVAEVVESAALASRPAVGGDEATAFEGWTAAVHAASELEANAPDERYRNRAKAVRRWIEARRPRPTINELRRLTGGRSDADSQA